MATARTTCGSDAAPISREARTGLSAGIKFVPMKKLGMPPGLAKTWHMPNKDSSLYEAPEKAGGEGWLLPLHPQVS